MPLVNSRFKFNFYFLGGGHFKYLYLCGGTPKIIKILLVVPQIIDGVPTPPGIFSWKSPKYKKIGVEIQQVVLQCTRIFVPLNYSWGAVVVVIMVVGFTTTYAICAYHH